MFSFTAEELQCYTDSGYQVARSPTPPPLPPKTMFYEELDQEPHVETNDRDVDSRPNAMQTQKCDSGKHIEILPFGIDNSTSAPPRPPTCPRYSQCYSHINITITI